MKTMNEILHENGIFDVRKTGTSFTIFANENVAAYSVETFKTIDLAICYCNYLATLKRPMGFWRTRYYKLNQE